MSHIPLPVGAMRRAPASAIQPAFNAPVRWTLIVLSWIAFGVAGYLAFHAVTGSPVAGCGMVTSAHGCDLVQSSSWSKWLGIPVAVLGLACYATLASLSILLGIRRDPANRWITTAFVLLAVVAAGASIWFIALQVFAIGSYCEFCLVTDICGILIGVIAVGAAIRAVIAARGNKRPGPTMVGLMPMRAATAPAAAKTPAVVMVAAPPSLLGSLAGAVPLLLVLIGGQLLFATKTYQVEKIALDNSLQLDDSKPSLADDDGSPGTTRVALRIPSDSEGDRAATNADGATTPDAKTDAPTAENANDKKSGDTASTDKKSDASAQPTREHVVKLLGGKLSLDVYKHPHIGSPDAPHIVVEMVSYNCPHCRKMHAIVEDALARYGDQVGVIIMPIPLDKECNKLISDPTLLHPGACGTARMVIGLAKLAPDEFGKFHNFLMSGDKEKPPEMSKVIPKAYGLVDAEKLRALMKSAEVNKQLDGYINLYDQLGKQAHVGKTFGLPVQVLGDTVVSGEVEKPEDVFKAWEEHLGVKPK